MSLTETSGFNIDFLAVVIQESIVNESVVHIPGITCQ